MGYYIQCSTPKDKANEIIENLDGIEISVDEAEMIIKENMGCVICVVDNGDFEAAAYCYNLDEFRQFSHPSDDRPKTWITVTKQADVERLTGFNR